MQRAIRSNWFVILLSLGVVGVIIHELIGPSSRQPLISSAPPADSAWVAPSLDLDQQLTGKGREMVLYGEDLIRNTAAYFGPNGSVKKISNGMNCQNCHLDAGTRQWGNNFSAVNATYPKFRARSNSVETVTKRINDCFERSLNGTHPDSNSNEMQAMRAYFNWLGKDVPKGKQPYSSGLPTLPFMDRAADTAKGRIVYTSSCQSCHGQDGAGIPNPDGKGYIYPPLWGPHSYNDGAGLFRISKFSSFVKSNMPFNQATHANAVLSDEQAWDVAGFVNSQTRPHKDQSGDWKDISKKSFDEPFGPYADGYNEQQHKYGPFQEIKNKTSK